MEAMEVVAAFDMALVVVGIVAKKDLWELNGMFEILRCCWLVKYLHRQREKGFVNCCDLLNLLKIF